MKEFDLRKPVCRWLLERGLSPVLECQSLNNCDVVGVKFIERPLQLVEMVAVELKLKDLAGVLRQCERNDYHSTETWAAMPLEFARKHRESFVQRGYGLVGINGESCVELVQPIRHEARNLTRWKSAMRRRRDEWKWRIKHPQMLRFPSDDIVKKGKGK